LDLQLFAEERREAPTQKRRADARRKGQVFKSVELTSVAVLVASVLALRAVGPYAVRQLQGLLVHFLNLGPGALDGASSAGVLRLGMDAAGFMVRAAAPVVGIAFVAGVAANLGQVGFVFAPHLLAPDLSRISPSRGLERLVSRRALIELVKATTKVAAVAGITYVTVRQNTGVLPALMDAAIVPALGVALRLASAVFWRVGLAMLVLAVADYVYQRFEHEGRLRMTREELKQEFKETEGHPQVRARIRQRQMQIARRRMMTEVKRADAVVANPVHYAVALRYDARRMAAPVVVAKGRGPIAERMKQVARQAGVAVVTNPPLAQALYRAVDIGRAIPEDLYQAVAEVLAFVYRLRGRGRLAGAGTAG